MDNWTEFVRMRDGASAQLVAGFLKSKGLEVEFFGLHSSSVLPHLTDSMARVMVRETQLREGRELLEEGAHQNFLAESEKAEVPRASALDDRALLPGDVELRRAGACAVFGILILPGISALLALFFLIEAARYRRLERDPRPWGRVVVILGFSALSFAVAYFALRRWVG